MLTQTVGVKCLSAMAVTEPLSFLCSRQALSWIMNLYARLDVPSIQKYTTDAAICISEASALFFPDAFAASELRYSSGTLDLTSCVYKPLSMTFSWTQTTYGAGLKQGTGQRRFGSHLLLLYSGPETQT